MLRRSRLFLLSGLHASWNRTRRTLRTGRRQGARKEPGAQWRGAPPFGGKSDARGPDRALGSFRDPCRRPADRPSATCPRLMRVRRRSAAWTRDPRCSVGTPVDRISSLVGRAPRHCAPGIPRPRHRPPTEKTGTGTIKLNGACPCFLCPLFLEAAAGALSRVRRRRARGPWRRRRPRAPGASGGRGAGRTRSARRRATCRRPRRGAEFR